jgi:uncharacterized protein
LAVAVSGGVDSLTLAAFAHRHGATPVTMFHAVSPAVPRAATERVQGLARGEGIGLVLLDAGEFTDPRYLVNPVNRCYFCKTRLYGAIRALTASTIVCGTNLDDRFDYRPGLTAAAEHGVRHPFVEAEMTKADVRALARWLGLADIADLPAGPCLASRVRTGIAVDPADLAFVEAAEHRLARLAAPGATVRCRITALGVVVEAEPGVAAPEELARVAHALCRSHGRHFAGVQPYRRGGMFVAGPDRRGGAAVGG